MSGSSSDRKTGTNQNLLEGTVQSTQMRIFNKMTEINLALNVLTISLTNLHCKLGLVAVETIGVSVIAAAPEPGVDFYITRSDFDVNDPGTWIPNNLLEVINVVIIDLIIKDLPHQDLENIDFSSFERKYVSGAEKRG